MEINLDQIQKVPNKFFQTKEYDLPRGYVFAPSYLQIGLIIVLIFFLVLTLGQLRKRFVGWQLKGVIPGVSFGFFLAIILGALIAYGWKSAPEPIAEVLDVGRVKMVNVLGTTDNFGIMVENLSSEELSSLQSLICKE